MTDMPGPGETRLNLIDGVEYVTLRADDFRTTLRVADAVHKAEMDTLRAENEQLRGQRDAYARYRLGAKAEIERLRAELVEWEAEKAARERSRAAARARLEVPES